MSHRDYRDYDRRPRSREREERGGSRERGSSYGGYEERASYPGRLGKRGREEDPYESRPYRAEAMKVHLMAEEEAMKVHLMAEEEAMKVHLMVEEEVMKVHLMVEEEATVAGRVMEEGVLLQVMGGAKNANLEGRKDLTVVEEVVVEEEGGVILMAVVEEGVDAVALEDAVAETKSLTWAKLMKLLI
eukprot:gene3413-3740_t